LLEPLTIATNDWQRNQEDQAKQVVPTIGPRQFTGNQFSVQKPIKVEASLVRSWRSVQDKGCEIGGTSLPQQPLHESQDEPKKIHKKTPQNFSSVRMTFVH